MYLFAAEEDEIATPEDAVTICEQLGEFCAHYEVLKDEDHLSVGFSKDMSYFKKVLAIL